MYVNGTLKYTITDDFFGFGTYDLTLATYKGETYFYDGTVDEFVVSFTARLSSWITKYYNTMNDPSSFFNVRPGESVP